MQGVVTEQDLIEALVGAMQPTAERPEGYYSVNELYEINRSRHLGITRIRRGIRALQKLGMIEFRDVYDTNIRGQSYLKPVYRLIVNSADK